MTPHRLRNRLPQRYEMTMPTYTDGYRCRWAVVEPRGLEPLTPCLQSRCATNCAMAPSCRRTGVRVHVSVERVRDLGPEIPLGSVIAEVAPRDVSRADGQKNDEQLLHQNLLVTARGRTVGYIG